MLRKIALTLGVVALSTSAFAAEKKMGGSKMVDLSAMVGYNNFILNTNKDNEGGYLTGGYDLGLRGLYNVPAGANWVTPVVGATFSYLNTSAKITGGNTEYSQMALLLNGGAEFKGEGPVSMLALVNLGMGFGGKAKEKSTSTDYKVNNQFIYGLTLGGHYGFAPKMAAGLELTYNRHQYKAKVDATGGTSKSAIGRETALNAVFTYSL